MEPRKERRKIVWAVLASLLVHFVVAFSVAAFGSATSPLPQIEDRPVELTMIDAPLPPPPPPAPK
ncbi:MAG: hypothetical protein LC627_02590, partial [Verrucomicrobiaceae bacterium]|nr:hypothetical protein [Verrucomicrobiaceae bacterium]